MSKKRSVKDQLGREITFNYPPKKIISTVPSITESLSDLNLDSELIGITRFCINPPSLQKEKEIIGGTKRLKVGKILDLNPDLIIGNKEENVKPQVEEIESQLPFWLSDVNTFQDNLNLIIELGNLCDRDEEAQLIYSNTKELLQQFRNSLKSKPKVLYFIWRGPYMIAANNTYIDSLLSELGLENAAKNTYSRYPKVSVEDLKKMDFDYILLSSEPFPFNNLHAQELQSLFPSKKILFVDGEILSYYGSRFSKEKEYLKAFLNAISN